MFNRIIAFSVLLSIAFGSAAQDIPVRQETTFSGTVDIVEYASPGKIPVEDFFRNPLKTSFKISPDGKSLSYMAPFESRMNIFVQPVDGGESVRITSVVDRDIADYFWANNSRLAFLKDDGGDENFALYSVSVTGGDVLPLTKFPGARTEMIDELENDDEHVLVAINKRDATIFDAYKLNVNTGALEMIEKNPGHVSAWITDHTGRIALATGTDGVNTSILVQPKEDLWAPVVTSNFKDNLTPLFFTFDNKQVYCSSNKDRDKSAIVILDIQDGKEAKVIYENNEVDVDNLYYSHKRKVLTAASYVTDRRGRKFFDAQTEKMFAVIQSKAPAGHEITVVSSDKDEKKFIVRTYSDRSRGGFYLFDNETQSLTLLENLSSWLKEDLLCDTKPIKITTRDGLTVHGYLTLPKGASVGLPVIVNPHGGPWARDEWGFNSEVQFLASRGYAVLQLNFRGSTGYGRKFWMEGFKQWGQSMQNDITDGVNYLIKQGIANPNRIGIYGGSYGGYATLSGLAFSPKVYACGVDYVGVSNLITFMQTIPPYWKPYLEMMYEMVGDPEKDKAMLEAASPALHADKIVAPLLIAQGAKDPRVNQAESDQMVKALRDRGVTVEYIVEPEEGHGFHNEENRFKFYRAMETFLDQNLNKPEQMKYLPPVTDGTKK